MKVLSFNILADQYIDYYDLQRDYPTINESDLKLEKRMPKILSYVKKIDADIVFLQEITPQTKKMFAKNFPDYKLTPLAKHKYSEGGSYNSGNMTMLKKSMFKKISNKSMFLAKTYNVFLITDCEYEGEPLTLINIHLDWEKEELRTKEAIALNKYLTKHKRCIVAGDFNTDADITHSKFKKLESAVMKNTSTFLCENTMIDYIYVRGFKVSMGMVDNRPIEDKRNCFIKTIKLYGSDHYPVISIVI